MRKGKKPDAALSRELLLEKLLKSYESSYDLVQMEQSEPDGLCATGRFHVEESSYVISQRATMWSTYSDEYVWFFSVPELTDAACESCIRRAYEEGMAKIDINAKGQHMVTRLVAVFLCDGIEEAALMRVRKCKLYKSFQFSLKGWMEFHAVAVDLGKGTVVCNRYGHQTAKHLKNIMNPDAIRRNGSKQWSILKQMLH